MFVQAKSFCRRILLVRFRLIRYLANDGVFCITQLAALGIMVWLRHREHSELSAPDVFLSQAAAGAVALLVGVLQVKHFITLGRLFRREVAIMNWRFGRWNLFVLPVCLRLPADSVLRACSAGWANGGGAIGSASAHRRALPGSHHGMSNIVGPLAARKFTVEGLESTRSYLNKTTRAFILTVTLAIVPIAAFSRTIIPALLGRSYASGGAVLWLWSATVIMMAASSGYGAISMQPADRNEARCPELSRRRSVCQLSGSSLFSGGSRGPPWRDLLPKLRCV